MTSHPDSFLALPSPLCIRGQILEGLDYVHSMGIVHRRGRAGQP